MRINEFIEYMGKNINRTLKEEQVLDLVKKKLEVKNYIPIKEKKELVEKIIHNSIYFENGNYKIDQIDCYMYFTMFTIDTYTNLEVDNTENCFDVLSESGLMPTVIGAIGQEYSDINTFLNMRQDEILESNSIEMQVGKFFTNILEKVDDFEKDLVEALNGLNLSKDSIAKIIKMIVQQ